MSDLVLESECLNSALDGGHDALPSDLESLMSAGLSGGHGDAAGADATRQEVFEAARALQAQYKSRTVTFSKKAFLNVINLCQDTCTYCTYKAEPGQAKAVMMSKRSIRDILALAARYGCVEALLVTGERPEARYAEARQWLYQNGFDTTADCLEYASEQALKMGLFPHTNAGNLTRQEMARLQKTNVSMGLMLESASPRLGGSGMAHMLAPSKRPAARIAALETAGELGIPMTTGLLLGIGETVRETLESLDIIRGIHKKYGHIQEIILQNFRPKKDTGMRGQPPADERYFMMAVAACRIMMPSMNIQIPPNLSPESYADFLSVGINDWGGISPLTPDYVNPEFPWPAIERLRRDTESAGYSLECRFPIYPEFAHMAPAGLRDKMSAMARPDGTMLVNREMWQK